MGVQRVYEESFSDLPTVRVPDWDLLDKLGDLLRPYGRLGFEYQVRDARGQYAAANTANLRKEIEARGTPLQTLSVLSYGADGTWLAVYMSPGWLGFGATIKSPEEPVKNHVAARLREIFNAHSVAEERPRRAPEREARGLHGKYRAWRGGIRARDPLALLLLGVLLTASVTLLASLLPWLLTRSDGAAQVVTTVPPSAQRETVTTSGREAREPEEGQVSVGSESSREFFDGFLVASLGPVKREGGAYSVSELTLRAGDVARCVYRDIRVGGTPGARTSEHVYWIDVRALSEEGAEVVAFRKDEGGLAGCPFVSVEPTP